MKWRALTMPREAVADDGVGDRRYGRFYIEPLERGFGNTIGNALRRSLLSSIQGAAVTNVRIEGVVHEFSTIPGVYEDVTDLILNIKQVRPELISDGPEMLVLDVEEVGRYSAANIEGNSNVKIHNPDLHLIELTKAARVRIEMEVTSGRGYVMAEGNKRADDPIGTIPVDSMFSPVTKVNYSVENTRVGQRTDFDRLILDVWTDGTISPADALSYSSKILRDHFQLFVTIEEEFVEEMSPEIDDETLRIRQLLKLRVDELELSVRSSNCLRAANIMTLEDLVRRSESEMLKYRNFGRKSLTELNAILSEMNLHFGMDVDRYKDPHEHQAVESLA
ncbi:MAG TPA: DNA-directed RNA polymerase subunit alpha [candidate division Zixibacteria bacterium]|jgi:DNA-directed RNA polymerase subunit alpha